MFVNYNPPVPIPTMDNYELYFSTFLRNGLLFPQRDDNTFYWFVLCLHSNNETVRSVALRVSRQLLAIGLFWKPTTYQNPELKWPPLSHYIHIYQCIYGFNCPKWAAENKLSESLMCSRFASLLHEFFSGPLTLLQLSRIELRRLVGMRQFERRVQQLPLPRLLLDYVWRADEMLLSPDHRRCYH